MKLFRSLLFPVWLGSLVVASWPAVADTTTQFGLLEVEVLVPDQTRKVQDAAFTRGLREVLVRLAGNADVLEQITLPAARGYVKQFHYDATDPGEDAQAAVPPAFRLSIQYDEDRLVSLLQNNALPVWTSNRDAAVIWLAVRDGLQHYLLREQDTSLIKQAVEQAAIARGVLLHWPKFDTRDRAILSFADVWGGFNAPLVNASQRYGSGPVIAANMAWDGSGWIGEWYLIDVENSRHWLIENIDYATLVTMGIDRVADELGARYAVLNDIEIADASHLRVEFEDVESVVDFKRVLKLLADSPAVRAVQPFEVKPTSTIFDVYLRTDERDFLDRMARQRSLRQLLHAPMVLQAPVAPPAADPATDTDSRGAQDEASVATALPQAPVADYRYQLLDEQG